MKNLFVVILLLLLLVGGTLGGGYFYASSQEEKLVLKANLEELSFAENTEYTELEKTTTAKLEMLVPLFAGSQALEEEQDSVDNVKIDIKNDEVEIETDGEVETLTYEKYNEDNNPIENYDLWEEEINAGNFKTKDGEFRGEDVWVFTFDSEKLTEDYIGSVEAKMQADAEELDFGVEGVRSTNWTMEFDGKFVFEIYVGKEDYVIKRAVISATDDVTLTFELEGETVDQMLLAYEQVLALAADPSFDPNALDDTTMQLFAILDSLNGEIPDTAGSFTFKDLTIDHVWEEIRLEDGKEMPTNPLMLLIAMNIL